MKIANEAHQGAIADDETAPGLNTHWDPWAKMWEAWAGT